MQFSYALLFFLFAIFVAAAPTTKREKRYGSWGFTIHADFLAAHGGEWTRVTLASEPQNSPVNEIQWLIKDTENVDHRPIQELCIEVGSTTVDNVYALEVDKKPGSDLVGTWKRAGTGSKFKISIVEVYGYETFDFEILDDGEWENENAREKEGPSESDLKEPQTPVQQFMPQSNPEQLAFSKAPDPNIPSRIGGLATPGRKLGGNGLRASLFRLWRKLGEKSVVQNGGSATESEGERKPKGKKTVHWA